MTDYNLLLIDDISNSLNLSTIANIRQYSIVNMMLSKLFKILNDTINYPELGTYYVE